MKHLLLATDGSQHAWPAAMELLDILPDSRLTVLYVSSIRIVAGYPEADFAVKSVLDFEQTVAADIEEEANKAFGKKYEGRYRFIHQTGSSPARTICDVAETEGADLIVLGSHNEYGTNRTYLGGVSTSVLHRSKVPVLVVKHKASMP